MDRGDTGRGRWSVVAPFVLANVLFGAGLFAHAFLYNFYLDALGLGEGFMGLAAASMTTGGLLALAPAGVALDRFGPTRAYAAAALLGFIGLSWGAFAESPSSILVSGVLAGCGTATWRVTMGPVLMAIAPPGIRSRAFSWNVAALLASGSLWTAAAGAIPAWWTTATDGSALTGIRVGLVACALGTLVSAPLVAAVLRGAVGARAGAPEEARPVAAGRAALSLRGLAVSGRIRILAFFVLVWMVGGGMVLPFFNLYFLRVHELSVERIGLLFGAVQALTALALVGGGEAAQRLGPLRALSGWTVLFPLALLGLVLSGGVTVAVFLYALQGLAPPATNPLIDELLLEEARPEEHGAVSSWRNGATELSGLLGASAGGFLLEAGSFGVLFVVAATFGAIGGALLSDGLGRIRDRRLPASVR